MKNKAAFTLFLKKEARELIGKNGFNAWILIGIFFISLISISFSDASLKYLECKMNDPFINWIDIIADQKGGNSEELSRNLLDSTNMNRFQYSIEKSVNELVYFRDKNNKDALYSGRSINMSSNLWSAILSKKNIIHSCSSQVIDGEYSLTISKDMLNKLGYDLDNIPLYINMSYNLDTNDGKRLSFSDTHEGRFSVAIPIHAIVKQLPNMKDFIATPCFFNEYNSENTEFNIFKEENNREIRYSSIYKTELEKIKAQYEEFQIFEVNYDTAWGNYVWNKNTKNLVIELKYDDNIEDEDKDSIINFYANKKITINDSTYRSYNFNIYNCGNENPEYGSNYISLEMKSLDSIKSLHSYIYNEYGMRIDNKEIETRENFNHVQRMGETLTYIIIIISILFILCFLFYILKAHFIKISRNIGTFKAFGMSDKELYSIYVILLLLLTIVSFTVAFIIIMLLQAIMSITNFNIEQNFLWINIYNIKSIILLIVALFASIISTYIVKTSLLKKTPGDLIYNRK